MKRLLGLLYLLVIILLPFWTFSGWYKDIFIFFILPVIIIFSVFVLNKFSKNVELHSKWLLYLLGTYIPFLMLIRDGGDGDSWQGIEVFISHLAGKSHWWDYIVFIPKSLGESLMQVSLLFFFCFFVLNIIFLHKDFIKFPKSGI